MSDPRRGLLYGADGRPANRAYIEVGGDGPATVVKDGVKASASAEELLMAMARAERDGMGHPQLIAEFGLMGRARSPHILNRALARGHELLRRAIVEGRQPAETVRVQANDEIEPDHD